METVYGYAVTSSLAVVMGQSETMSRIRGANGNRLTLVLLRLAYLPRRLCKVLLLDIFPAWRKKKKVKGEGKNSARQVKK